MTFAAFARPAESLAKPSSALQLLVDRGNPEVEFADDLARRALRCVAAFELMLQNHETLADVGKRRALLEQADLERERPCDIGASVEVVADPGCERRQLRPQLERRLAELLRSDAEESVQQFFIGIAQIANGILRTLVLVLKRQRRLGAMRQADGYIGRWVGDGDLDHPAVERVGQTEGRVSRQNDAGSGARPAFGKGFDRACGLVRRLFDVGREILECRSLVDIADIFAQRASAANAGAIHQPACEALHLFERDCPGLEPARQIERNVQNRIERRIVGDLRSKTLQFVDQLDLIELGRANLWRRVLHHSKPPRPECVGQYSSNDLKSSGR